jgi:hypothetical protein
LAQDKRFSNEMFASWKLGLIFSVWSVTAAPQDGLMKPENAMRQLPEDQQLRRELYQQNPRRDVVIIYGDEASKRMQETQNANGQRYTYNQYQRANIDVGQPEPRNNLINEPLEMGEKLARRDNFNQYQSGGQGQVVYGCQPPPGPFPARRNNYNLYMSGGTGQVVYGCAPPPFHVPKKVVVLKDQLRRGNAMDEINQPGSSAQNFVRRQGNNYNNGPMYGGIGVSNHHKKVMNLYLDEGENMLQQRRSSDTSSESKRRLQLV